MRRALRIHMVLAATLLIGWAVSFVPIGHHTLAGHVSAWLVRQSSIRSALTWTRHKLRRNLAHETRADAPQPRERTPAGSDVEATERRVAVLEDAARRAEALDPPPRAVGKQTRIDEHLSSEEKKSLDELLSTRKTRSR
jgi:hypothetical protein